MKQAPTRGCVTFNDEADQRQLYFEYIQIYIYSNIKFLVIYT